MKLKIVRQFTVLFGLLLALQISAKAQQSFSADTIAYMAEMQQQYNKIQALKSGSKELVSQKVNLEKESADKAPLYKKIGENIDGLLKESSTKEIEKQTFELEMANDETESNLFTNKIKKINTLNEELNELSLTLAEKVLDGNKACNLKSNEVLEQSQGLQNATRHQLLLAQGLVKIQLSMDSTSNQISKKTIEVIANPLLSDSLLALSKVEIGMLKSTKVTLQLLADSISLLQTSSQRSIAGFTSNLNKLKTELQQLVSERELWNTKIKNNNAEVDFNKTELANLTKKLNEKTATVKTVKEKIELLQLEIDGLAARLVEFKLQKTNLDDQFRKSSMTLKQLQIQISAAESPAFDLCLQGVQKGKNADLSGAIALLRQACELDKQNSLPYYLRGYSNFMAGNLPEAWQDINNSISLLPEAKEAYGIRAMLHVKDNDYLAAVKDYDKIVSLDPVAKESYYLKGNINYKYLNETEKACKDWEKASTLGDSKATASFANYCMAANKRTSFNMAQIVKEAIDTSYAYNPANPVKVGRNTEAEDFHANEISYFQLLRGTAGEPVKYQRLGTCCQYKSANGVNGIAMLDKFLVTYSTKRGTVIKHTLFISSYDYSQPLLPRGFTTTHVIE